VLFIKELLLSLVFLYISRMKNIAFYMKFLDESTQIEKEYNLN